MDQGPAKLVEVGLIDQLKGMGWNVHYDEKFPDNEHLRPTSVAVNAGNLKNAKYVSRVCENISKTVSEYCHKGMLALTLGGDHSVAMGTISGSASKYPDIGVIWVDAHAVFHLLN